VGANYRSACKGKSTADFINKVVIVEEEADESIYWLELMEESELVTIDRIKARSQRIDGNFYRYWENSKSKSEKLNND